VNRLILVPLSVALVAALPSPALAKGGDEGGAGLRAVIKGPGLDKPISLAGVRKQGAALVRLVADAAGFPAALGGIRDSRFVPDPMLRTRPSGDLGQPYAITYLLRGPNGEVARLTQDLYPYAKLRPAPTIAPGQTVTYMAPGQPVFGTERTRGGWYVATSYLKDNLVAAGLPASAPTDGGGPEPPWTVLGTLTALGLVLALAALLTRRHGQRRTVTA
jgi:hypothetical protein